MLLYSHLVTKRKLFGSFFLYTGRTFAHEQKTFLDQGNVFCSYDNVFYLSSELSCIS